MGEHQRHGSHRHNTGAFTDTQNGVQYVVTTTGTFTGGAGTYSWSSTDTADIVGGTGTSVASTNTPIGTKGITINFSVLVPIIGSKYTVKAGTQSASALSLNTATGSVTTTNGNIAPTLANNATTVTGGGVSASAYSASPVKFTTAVTGTGMGTYSVVPGANVSTDPNSWAATYTAGLQYTIVTGP